MKKTIYLEDFYYWKREASTILPETIENASIAGRTIWDVIRLPNSSYSFQVTFMTNIRPYYENAILHPKTLVTVRY